MTAVIPPSAPSAALPEIVDELRTGRPVVLWSRYGAVLAAAAEHATADIVNLMAREARGLVWLALTAKRCEELGLHLMAPTSDSALASKATVSIEARTGVTTGISAADRARTIAVAINPACSRVDLVQPGHIFPLRATCDGPDGYGPAEAAVDLARLCGLTPAGVLCEIMNDDGSTASGADLGAYCARLGVLAVRVADVRAERQRAARIVERVADALLPTRFGPFRAVGYRMPYGSLRPIALVRGDVEGGDQVPVAIHRACLLGDVFRACEHGCRERLETSLKAIDRAGTGVLVYVTGDATHHGLMDDPVALPVGIDEQILLDLGVRSAQALSEGRAA